MTLLWLVTGASLVLAFVAWRQARTALRRLDELTQMYWSLNYQYGELKARLQRPAGEAPPAAQQPEPHDVRGGFVPLSSLKR